MSTEPSAILNITSEHKPVDNGILKWVLNLRYNYRNIKNRYVFLFVRLLQSASSIHLADNTAVQLASQVQSKRILYVKTIVRMLRLCGSKSQQLLTTPEGVKAFHTTVIDLIKLIEGVVSRGKCPLIQSFPSQSIWKFHFYFIENQHDSIHMMIEIVGSLQSQGEFTSR